MGGGPSRGTGPIHCEEVAELLGEHYYDEAWRVFERVSSYRTDDAGAYVVPFKETGRLIQAFAHDMLVRFGDDEKRLKSAAALFTRAAAQGFALRAAVQALAPLVGMVQVACTDRGNHEPPDGIADGRSDGRANAASLS